MDKNYYLDYNAIPKFYSKFGIYSVVGIGLIGILFSTLTWWAKGVFLIGAGLLFLMGFYQLKYILGLKKNPFIISPKEKTLRYYNEFEGNKTVDISKVYEIKVYSRENNIFLLEMFVTGQKQEENVNVEGLTSENIEELISDLNQLNKDIVFTSNRPETENEK